MTSSTGSDVAQNLLPPPPVESCQFDFWLGDWDVCWGDGLRGENHVERIMNGHVVRETFDGMPGTALKGMSVSTFDVTVGAWRQTWVDNYGGYLDFTGGMSDGQMILSRSALIDGRPVWQRMVWLNIGPDSLDWHWERSEDGGLTWQIQWALHYTRKKIRAGISARPVISQLL